MIISCKVEYESAPETDSFIIDTSKLSNQTLIKAFNSKEDICFGYPNSNQMEVNKKTTAFFSDEDWEEFEDELEDVEVSLPANVSRQVNIWVY